jgi:hypothetical protein
MRFRMTLRPGPRRLISAVALLLLGACSNEPHPGSGTGAAGTNGSTGSAGMSGAGTAGGNATGVAGSSGAGTAGATGGGVAGTAGGGVAGTTGSGAAGTTGTAGAGAAGTGAAGTGAAGITGTAGATGAAGTSASTDPPPPRPLNITPGGGCNCDVKTAGQTLSVDTRKTIQGKLVITLGGICGGPGGGGLEGVAKNMGFHVFQVATDTCIEGSKVPQKYKDTLKTMPNDPEANRQEGDARMELWDGVDRVDWINTPPGSSMVSRTEAALKVAVTQDPGGDWGYYLNADGHVRWTDVFMVGYSWGSQTIAMISKYVRFGRVFCTSGPQAEGFPNATWISQPSATPADRLFMAVGFNLPYPSMDPVDIAPNTVTSMLDTCTKAGWIGPPMNVLPGDVGPFTGKHMFAMVAKFPYQPHALGGHGIFCYPDPLNQWQPLCNYAFGLK